MIGLISPKAGQPAWEPVIDFEGAPAVPYREMKEISPTPRYMMYHREPYQMNDDQLREVKLLSRMHEFFNTEMQQKWGLG